jgi:hypothetical protein
MVRHDIPLPRPLLGVVIVLAFMLQLFVGQAEQIGFWECPCHHAADNSTDTFSHADESDHSLPLSSSDCQCACHVPVSPYRTIEVTLSMMVVTQCDYLLRDAFCPDAPVRAIDHPPQLA